MSRQRAPGGALARRLERWVREAFQAAAPARWVPLPPDVDPPSIGLVSVYRAVNAGLVRTIVDQLPEQAEVRLWALDEVADDLRSLTVGSGPGGRLELLNRLVAGLELEVPDLLVLSDDDIRFVIGDLDRLLRLGRALEMDLFQPAHSRRSKAAFAFTRKRPLLVARETTFVEQGPIVVLSAAAQHRLLPLPEDLVMGWGLEVRWQQGANGLRRGIVDAVAIRHLAVPRTYDTAPELARLQQELEAAGLTDLRELQREVRRHRVRDVWRATRRAQHRSRRAGST